MISAIYPCKSPFHLNLVRGPSPSREPRRLARRLHMMAATPATSMVELKKGIAEFYDESSGVWENVWGDHMHHGFYDPHVQASISDHRSAQIRMIEEALRFANVLDDSLKRPKSIVDVGCGIGGSSRYLARKYGAKCQGITLSPIQAQRAHALAIAKGLADKVSFQVADALEQPFPNGQFDLVWSMESGEHMPDKRKRKVGLGPAILEKSVPKRGQFDESRIFSDITTTEEIFDHMLEAK